MPLNIRYISQNRRFLNFIFFGGLNTAATYSAYLVLSNYFHYQFAYLIAYVSGIVLAYILNLRFVFKERSSFKKALGYPLVYAVQYLLGAGLMYLLLKVFSLPNALAPLIVTVVLIPVAYYMNKKVLSG